MNTPLDIAFRAYIHQRDGYICQVHKACRERRITPPVRECAAGDAMCVYHLIPVSIWPSGRYVEENAMHCCSALNFREKFDRVAFDKLHRQLWPARMAKLDLMRKTVRKTDKSLLLAYFKSKRRAL